MFVRSTHEWGGMCGPRSSRSGENVRPSGRASPPAWQANATLSAPRCRRPAGSDIKWTEGRRIPSVEITTVAVVIFRYLFGNEPRTLELSCALCYSLPEKKRLAEAATKNGMERTLSRNEAKVILDLEWRKQKTVTLAELRQALDASEGYARKLAHGLVKKGWLERLRPGLFQLVPAERGREGVADTNPLAAGAVLISPYFYSFGTACTHHGFTEQVFSEVYLACQHDRRPETIRGKRYVFVQLPQRRFFGFEEIAVLGCAVQMATPERALLDAIERPQYAGGIGEVSRIAQRAARTVSWEVLIELSRKWGSSALVQRLGYFMDLHQTKVSDDTRACLLELIRPQSKIQLGSRAKWGTRGKLVRPWNVVENIPRAVLMSKQEKPGRRVVFAKKEPAK
jgi:predicted transcriptional regulator of viral defense system